MTQPEQHSGDTASAFSGDAMHPNLPEVSGTTLPLLSGVLAGFAITSIVQLALSPDRDESLAASSVIAVAVLLISVICFLNSIVFAIKAQASNYLPFLDLSDAALQRLNVSDPASWLASLERRWFLFQAVATGSFYLGAILFLAGLNLIVWTFVGSIVGALFLAAVIAMVALTIVLDLFGTAWMQRRFPPG